MNLFPESFPLSGIFFDVEIIKNVCKRLLIGAI